METTKLSSKGQVIIPKPFRAMHHWAVGQEFVVIDTGDGVLLKPKTPFLETSLENVAACLQFAGKPKSLNDMEKAIKRGVKDHFHDSD